MDSDGIRWRKRGIPKAVTRLKAHLPEHLAELPDYAQRAYEEADIDGLDHEVRACEANLTWAEGEFAKDPHGGVVTRRGGDEGGDVIVPWSDLVAQHAERCAKMKIYRAKLLREVAERLEAETMEQAARKWKPPKPK